MKKIIVYCEKTGQGDLSDVSYELISKAFKLREQAWAFNVQDNNCEINAVVIASNISQEAVNKAYSAGANKVILIKNEILDEFNHIRYSKCFVDYYKQNPSDYILFPATPTARALAPRVTTALDTGLVADCVELEFILRNNEIKLAATRPTFGAELMATILSKKTPECATVRKNVFKAEFNVDNRGEFIEFYPNDFLDAKVRFIRNLIEDAGVESGFKDAKIVLCAGWGLYTPEGNEYFEKLKKLAELIGAKFASTRKVVDYNIVDNSCQIGQTGSTVESTLYIGFGVSGAIQHISGMKNCKTIVAVNTDTNAPIFDYCDYKVVKDAKVIIDELLTMLVGESVN